MFETFVPADRAARLRAAAISPFAAFLVLQAYDSIAPLFSHVPAGLFVLMQLLTAAGVVGGVVAIVRALRGPGSTWTVRDVAWLVAATAITLVCAFFCLRMTLPWLV